MNKPLIWMGLVAIVGGAAYVAYNTNGELAGHATGANSAKEAVWSELSGLEDTYLKEWGDAFEEGNPSAIDVLEAFNEVGFAVTGQGGLWRNKVPNQWLGCQADAESAPCKAIHSHEDVFAEWDDFQTKISGLNERKARRFLAKNKTKMLDYLTTYVPRGKSNAEIEGTPFFSSSVKPALDSGE